MVFRLPTYLDNFIPPPAAQANTHVRPWRGTLTIRGMRVSDLASNQEIRVTAVETDGDCDVRRWPSQFFAHIAHGQPILREVRAWIQRNAPPISTFMPDRLPDPDANVVNMANFRSLSRLLFEQQLIAIAPWGTAQGDDSTHFPGGGIIIVPAEHSSALLVAALFFTQFPDIINTSTGTGTTTASAPLTLPLTPLVTTPTQAPHIPYTYSAAGLSTNPDPYTYYRHHSQPPSTHYTLRGRGSAASSGSRSPPDEQMISAAARASASASTSQSLYRPLIAHTSSSGAGPSGGYGHTGHTHTPSPPTPHSSQSVPSHAAGYHGQPHLQPGPLGDPAQSPYAPYGAYPPQG
ncbi:hypothetical protein MKEN_00043400 [Mycena kentingensis (nom. inval.)]|nr:hypothetical protein MKEN_00043400 [Mycena kentingensis (nom. inval.)]